LVLCPFRITFWLKLKICNTFFIVFIYFSSAFAIYFAQLSIANGCAYDTQIVKQKHSSSRLAIKFIYLQFILYAIAIVNTSCFCFPCWKDFYFSRTIGSIWAPAIRLFKAQFYDALTGYYIYVYNPRPKSFGYRWFVGLTIFMKQKKCNFMANLLAE